MRTWLATAAFEGCGVASGLLKKILGMAALVGTGAARAVAQPGGEGAGGEASLKLPDLSSVPFLNGAIDGHRLLMIGILFCIFGLGFGMVIYMRLKNLPVHRSMREISELIYETCKTYLVTQGRFILLLWAFIASSFCFTLACSSIWKRCASRLFWDSAWSGLAGATGWRGSEFA